MNNYTDQQRSNRGFLTAVALTEKVGKNNSILDVSSVLISENVEMGKGNVLYPGVVIERQGDGKIVIGDENIFYPGVYILSSAGEIRIGNQNDFGPAGATIKANMPDAFIQIGHQGRYCDGTSIMGKTTLGPGSQVLGNITVQSCTLAGGGTFKEANPDKRAAVLKGFGLARGITLEAGQVVNGSGDFSSAPVEQQSFYHPKAKA